MRTADQPVVGTRPLWTKLAATVITVAAWLLALTAVSFAVLADLTPRGENLFLYVDVMVAAVYGTVAGVILWRRQHIVVWLLALAAIGGGVSAVAGAYGIWQSAQPGLLFQVAWVPGTLALFTVIPWLVRDHPLSPLAWLGVTAGAAVSLGFTVISYRQDYDLQKPFLYATIAVGLTAAAEVEWRHRRGPVAERIGLGWLALGTAVMSLSFVPLLVTFGTLPANLTPILHLLCQAVFPAAILVSVLRQRLWGIDIAISRTLTAWAVTIGLLALYAAVAAWAPEVLGDDGEASLAAAVAVVVAVQPTRLWVEQRVHSLVYGVGHDPVRATRALSSQLGHQGTDDLLNGLVESVATMLRLESAVIRVDEQTVARYGDPTSSAHEQSLTNAGVEIGTLIVTAPPGEALGGRSTRSLDELSPVVAAGLAVTIASWQLEAAQADLTQARLHERKVIRRELHDGLGPSLTGLRLGLQGARNLVASDPAAAEQILAALQVELDRRVEDVRELSHSLLPPVLAELGLQAALSELAGRHREAGLEVEVTCPSTVGLSPELANAAYAIVSEAVTNAARHSGSDVCRIAVTIDHVGVDLTVEDEGVGLAPDRIRGVGTSSMHERAVELGGSIRIEQQDPHGTTVVAHLPLTHPQHGRHGVPRPRLPAAESSGRQR